MEQGRPQISVMRVCMCLGLCLPFFCQSKEGHCRGSKDIFGKGRRDAWAVFPPVILLQSTSEAQETSEAKERRTGKKGNPSQLYRNLIPTGLTFPVCDGTAGVGDV